MKRTSEKELSCQDSWARRNFNKIDVSAHAFSKSAEESITAAGGTVTVLPKPWGEGRPPARGMH